MKHPPLLATFLSILAVLILASIPAWATLGQSEASVTTDQLQMKTQARVQSLPNYTVHQLTSAGSMIQEFVSPQGQVFAVTWSGRSVPDMNQLLGTYVTNLQTATPAQTHILRLRGLTVRTDDFVYSSFCHMQSCVGKAYVPSLLPSGLSAEVVR